MKKRLLTCILACALAVTSLFSFSGLETVSAAAGDGKSISTAINASFDQDYSIKWGDVEGQVYSKLVVPSSGTVTVNCSEAKGTIHNSVSFYKADGSIFNVCYDEDNIDGTNVHISLNAGTYYVGIEPFRQYYVKGETSTFSFHFDAADNTEAEPNNSQATATPIIADKEYYAYLGDGFSYTGDYGDGLDYYKINLIEGHTYKLVTDAFEGPFGKPLAKIIETKNGSDKTLRNGNLYTAPYTGDYFFKVDNYGNQQYKYTFKLQSMYFKWAANYRSCTVYYYNADGSEASSYKCKVTADYVSKASASWGGYVKYRATSPVSDKDYFVYDSAPLYKIKKGHVNTTAYAYDGKVKHPTVTITDDEGHVIDPAYYTLSYSAGCKEVGTYNVYVKFDKTYYVYDETLTYSYKINPATVNLKKLKAASKALTATWAKQSGVNGYQLQYATNKKFSKCSTVTISNAKTSSKKLTKLKSKKTYYVRIRSFKKVNNVTYYGKWSKVKSVKVK